MEQIVLKATRRDIIGKHVKELRREGQMPAVLYGRHQAPITVSLNQREAGRILPTLTSAHLVVLDVDGERMTALVREKQRHPVTGLMLHVDFQVVSMTEKLRAFVPIFFEGDAPAVKNWNGIVVAPQEQIEVECLPSDLPERITVSLTGLTQIGNAIYVRDLKLSDKVTVLTDADEVVVVVTAPAAEDAVTSTLEGGAEPEVIERGKKDEDF